jgi:hypothetical protein
MTTWRDFSGAPALLLPRTELRHWHGQTLSGAGWGDPVLWKTKASDLVLLNSAANAAQDLRDEDMLSLWLSPGEYVVEFAFIKASHWGWFHRLTLAGSTGAT